MRIIDEPLDGFAYEFTLCNQRDDGNLDYIDHFAYWTYEAQELVRSLARPMIVHNALIAHKEPRTYKILFVDVDYVLNTRTTTTRTTDGWDFVEDEKMEYIRQICAATGAVVVLSSDWRFGREEVTPYFRQLKAKFIEYDCPIRDFTGDTMNSRSQEIHQYLKTHDFIENYCVLDDLPAMFKEISKYWVRTSEREGLTAELRDKAIEILGKI